MLDTLEEFADVKANLFKEELANELKNAGIGSDLTLPITHIVTRDTETHAYASDSADHIVDAVASSVQKLLGVIKGDDTAWDKIASAAIDIAKDSLNTIITAFLGASEGTADYTEYSFIYLDGVVLMRVDLKGWRRDITSTGIKQYIQNVSAFAYAKSVVDVAKTDVGTFTEYVQRLVAKAYDLNDPIEVADKCQEFYDHMVDMQKKGK